MAEEVKKKKRPTALKRVIQDQKKCLQNKMRKSSLRTAVRKLKEVITNKEEKEIQAKLKLVYKELDKGVKNGILKKNTATRSKSRLTALSRKA